MLDGKGNLQKDAYSMILGPRSGFIVTEMLSKPLGRQEVRPCVLRNTGLTTTGVFGRA